MPKGQSGLQPVINTHNNNNNNNTNNIQHTQHWTPMEQRTSHSCWYNPWGLNLRPEGSIWNSACEGCRGSDTMDRAFKMSLPSCHQRSYNSLSIFSNFFLFLRWRWPNQQNALKERTDSIKAEWNIFIKVFSTLKLCSFLKEQMLVNLFT